jgi:hypothetical protein
LWESGWSGERRISMRLLQMARKHGVQRVEQWRPSTGRKSRHTEKMTCSERERESARVRKDRQNAGSSIEMRAPEETVVFAQAIVSSAHVRLSTSLGA